MEELIKHIKFPLFFNEEKLQKDIQKLLSQNWVNHYNKGDYEGNWSSISLMSVGGNAQNIYALNNTNEPVIYTNLVNDCDYFKEILDEFLFEKTSVRLLRLAVGAIVKPHQDHCLGYEDGCFRLHIPVITNDQVEFILDNERLMMKAGECWYIDANFTHSVINRGNQDRIHLVIDGIRNEWTDALFFQNATENQFIKPIPKMSLDQQLLMIEELKKMNTAVANNIIADLLKNSNSPKS
jgi:hypothetical protein